VLEALVVPEVVHPHLDLIVPLQAVRGYLAIQALAVLALVVTLTLQVVLGTAQWAEAVLLHCLEMAV
jgi:hypothetical protein